MGTAGLQGCWRSGSCQSYIGNVAWSLPSEINYYLKREKYYDTLKIGASYSEVDYAQALPFLLLLPSCFAISKKYYVK